MRGTAFRFLVAGVVFVLIGMIWGIHMAASGDHLLTPAHAHLNLIGFVMGAIFAFYLTLTPQADGAAARLLFWLWLAVTVLMAVGIPMAITGRGEGVAIIASLLGVVAMLLFGWILVRNGLGRAGG